MIFKDQTLNDLQSKYALLWDTKQMSFDEATENLICDVVKHCANLCDGHADWMPVDNEECKDEILRSVNKKFYEV